MRAVCVDDEELILDYVVYLCNETPQIDEVKGFSNPRKALDWLKDNPVDIAILDIDMPEIDGINLAIKIKQLNPDTSIIFLTGYSDYAVEAFKIHAQGYLMKPVNKEALAKEITLAVKNKNDTEMPHIFVRTFGEFDLYLDGQPIAFKRSKSKELLAFLVDKSGASVTRANAFAALYEDKPYDRPMQKQFDVIIRSLKETLDEYGLSDLVEMKSGNMNFCTEKAECDLYRLLKGDVKAINAYRGEYMSSYPWAALTEGYLADKMS